MPLFFYRKLLILFLDRAVNKTRIYLLLKSKENDERRNDTDNDTCKDYLPLSTVRTHKAVKRCGYHRQLFAGHIKLRGVEVVVNADDLDYKDSSDRRTKQGKNDLEEYREVVCTVNDSALIKRIGDIIEKLHKDVNGDNISADVEDNWSRHSAYKTEAVHYAVNSYLHRDSREKCSKEERSFQDFSESSLESLENISGHRTRDDSACAGDKNDYRSVSQTEENLTVNESGLVV